MTQDIEITKEKTNEILKEIEDAFYDIPFGNSAFQTEMFVVAAQITPERMYRQIGLEMHSKLSNLRENQFLFMKREIELEQKKEKLKNNDIDYYEKKLIEIEILEIESNMVWDRKLINDQLAQLNILYKHFKLMPKITREQFENGEQIHFEQKLRRQMIGLTGAKEGIVNMIDDKKTIEQFENLYSQLPDNKKQTMLNDIAKQSLAGYIEFEQTNISK